MTLSFQSISLDQKGALVVFAGKDAALLGLAVDADKATNGALSKALSVSRFKGGKGEKLEIIAPQGLAADRVIVMGIGDSEKLSENDQLSLGASAYAAVHMSGAQSLYIAADFDGANAGAIAEGVKLRVYRFDKYRTTEKADKKPSIENVVIGCADVAASEEDFKARSAVVDGVDFTRDLTTEVPNILTPAEFAARCQELAELGVDVEVLGEAEMEKLGMHSLLGVGLGSENESKLAIMVWNGGGDEAPIALVGKGVTFDTGGISLKPGPGMQDMKWDMGGAGIVAGTMKALAGRKAKANVIGILGLVENMPDGRAQRPGDVVKSMSGQTIEILNTDAEGRLVLADALWYCQDRFKPRYMVDLATLTGAMIISLGHEYAGYFSSDDILAEKLNAASAASGDKLWRMPLHDNYDKLINSSIADVKNLGDRGAGSITAAQFLKRFTNDVPWAHIDVAGVVWSEKDMPLSAKGATGFGVRLLDKFIDEMTG